MRTPAIGLALLLLIGGAKNTQSIAEGCPYMSLERPRFQIPLE